MYGFLPVSVSVVPPTPPFTVTAFGAAAPFNLLDSDVNDPTHNSFGEIAGLTPIDLDNGTPKQATTLAGVVFVTPGGFGHSYEEVSAPGLTWDEAKAAAEALSTEGCDSYLAVITSQEELSGRALPLPGMI